MDLPPGWSGRPNVSSPSAGTTARAKCAWPGPTRSAPCFGNPASARSARSAGHDILQKCIELGGSVTGEHGIGVEKIDFMEKQFAKDDLDAMRALRRVFDPENRCNPHKMFPGSKRCADFAPKKQIAA